MVVPPKPSLFHWRFLTGDKPLLTLDDEFLCNHSKVLLTSDASDIIWKVKLEGSRLAGGWREFAAVHNFSDGDVLTFRHKGDEIFHVADSSDIQHASPSFTDTDDSESDDESDDVDDEDNDEDVDDDNDAGDILVEKSKKPEADSSTGGYSCFLRARVTPSSLIKDRLDLSKAFNKFVSFDEHNIPCEIYLANEKGRKWTLILSSNISTSVFYIRRGWANFCSANRLSQGDICNFKLSESGERPVLLLCSLESGNGHKDKEEEKEDAVKICSVGGCSKEKNTPYRFLTLTFTPNRVKTGHLYISMLSSVFFAESGLKKSGEITLLDNHGRKWPSYLVMTGKPGQKYFYIRKGWREMCKANGVKVNDSFVFELICEAANPIFKFHSKIENKGKGNTVENTLEEVSKRGRPRVLNRSSSNLKGKGNTVEKTPEVSKRGRAGVLKTSSSNFKRKQPESCPVSGQVANVKRCIQDTLNTIRHFRAELKTREKNLETSLLEVEDLGERIFGISKILSNS